MKDNVKSRGKLCKTLSTRELSRQLCSSIGLPPPTGVECFDLAPEHDALLVASTDGQIFAHSISDAGSMQGFGRVQGQASGGGGSAPVLSGLHFVGGSGGGQFVSAARGGLTAQLFDVASSTVLRESEELSASFLCGRLGGIMACEAVSLHAAALLVGADGAVRLWDARAPRLAHAGNLKLSCYPEESCRRGYQR